MARSSDSDSDAYPTSTRDTWPKAMATVTACKYQFGAGQALAFGIPLSRHFLISFNYFVEDVLHTGQFTAAKPVPQGTLFPIAYNPDAPHENEKSRSLPIGRSPLIAVGIVGSIVLSLGWLLLLRSCH